MKKLVLCCCSFLFVWIALAACSEVHKASEPISPITISAKDLWNDFVVNKADAVNRYDGNLVKIHGTIAEISESFMGSPCILLENGVDSIPDGIFCFFPSDFSIFDYTVGETITVVGTCVLSIHIAGDDAPFISIENAAITSP